MVGLLAGYPFAFIAILLFVTVSAHTLRQAHHDLDMLISTCKMLRSDAKAETVAADGAVRTPTPLKYTYPVEWYRAVGPGYAGLIVY